MTERTSDAPILDYAGPISRSALRLSATSDLRVTFQPRELIVRETLAGRRGAVGALVFAALVMIIMIRVEKDMSRRWRRHVQEMLLIGGTMAAEGVVAALVVNQTWRRTVLTVTPAEVTLLFAAPFATSRRYHWAAEQVARVEVVDSVAGPDRQNGPIVPELELTMCSGPPVRLFTGHPRPQLVHLAASIRAIQPPLPSARM